MPAWRMLITSAEIQMVTPDPGVTERQMIGGIVTSMNVPVSGIAVIWTLNALHIFHNCNQFMVYIIISTMNSFKFKQYYFPRCLITIMDSFEFKQYYFPRCSII